MSAPLKSQIRDYFSYVDEQQGSVDIAAEGDGTTVVVDGAPPTEFDEYGAAQADGAMNELSVRASRRRSSQSWLLAAAAVLLIAVGVFVVFDIQGDDGSPVITEPPGTTEPPETSEESQSLSAIDEALALTDGYFAAFAAGDLDAVMALFSPDATFADSFGAMTRDEFEAFVSWDIAQGTIRVSPQCSAGDEADAVEVTCSYGDHQYLARAVGAPPVQSTVTAIVTDDAITRWVSIFGQPDYLPVNVPFDQWLSVNHPADAVAAGCCAGSTVEEAQRNGQLRARYADEWAAYLEANDCTYDTEC